MMHPKIAAKLARARRFVAPLVKSEGARVFVPSTGRTPPSSVEWTYAPGHLVHEASAAALREVGLELIVAGWTVTERSTICVAFILVDTDEDGPWWSWTSELPYDSGKVGATVAGAGALAMVIRHTRLTLLDIPCVPEEEARANRQREAEAQARGRRETRAAALPADFRPRPREEEDDAMPAWAAPPSQPEPAPIITEEEIRAVEAELVVEDVEALKRQTTMAWLAARQAGATADLASVFVEVFGEPRRPDELGPADWRKVMSALERAAAQAGEVGRA